jgi:hypothetical protein
MQSLTGFIDSLADPIAKTRLSPSKMSDALGMDVTRFAGMVGVHRNTVYNNPNSPALQDGMLMVNKVLSAAFELNGDIDKAVFWFKNHPIADFGHKTPMELVQAGKGEAVIAYITSLSGGASG